MATVGAQSLLWLVLVAAGIVSIAGLAFAVWSLRPVPAYTSEGIEAGSPFGVTFRIENTSAWFPLSHLSISCVLMQAGAPDMPPVEASGINAPAGNFSRLEPGQWATFKCPFRGALRGPTSDELGIALRSEIYFRSAYDLPLTGSFRITDNGGPFVLNTKVLPPRWTGKRW
jgi:hypothetical protein